MTKKRSLIWKILKHAQAEGHHLSAEEVYFQAKREDPEIVMATVYNNLNALDAEGVIRRVRRSGGPDYFDGNTATHDHMVCDRCGRIQDVSLGDFAADLQRRLGTKITGYELNIHYVCDKCSQIK